MKYILFTNVWNEEKNIERLANMVSTFSLKPDLWVWIDDGSTNGSRKEIDRIIDKYHSVLSITVYSNTLLKNKGDLSSLGMIYNYVFNSMNLREREYDFMSIIDVDTIMHSDFFKNVSILFDLSPNVGVISGHYSERQKIPVGNSKCVRWKIIQGIEKFWDPAPDTLLNIKAKAQGFDLLVYMDTPGFIGGPASSRNRTETGAEYAGRLWAYVGASRISAVVRVVYRIFKRRHALAFWRGYTKNRAWRCDDPDVIREYGGTIDEERTET